MLVTMHELIFDGAAQRECEQPILLLQILSGAETAAGERGDAPLVVCVDDRGVPSLMRPMKRAQAHVDDADGSGRHGHAVADEHRRPRQTWPISRRGHSLNAFRGMASTRSTAIRSAAGSEIRPSQTRRARNAESSRRAASWRAGIERNALVSSTKPDPR